MTINDKQHHDALMAYKSLLEYIALLEFTEPNVSTAKIIRASQCMLNEYPCDMPTTD